MRTIAACLALVILLFTTVGFAEEETEPTWKKCSHVAPIQYAGPTDKGLVEVPLTPQVHDLAKLDLSDLRVVENDSGTEVGFVLRTKQRSERKEALDVHLLNKAYIAGKHSSVVVDFQKKVAKNQIEVNTAGSAFFRKANIEASDDGKNWQTVREGAYLFRIDRGKFNYDKTTLTFPENDFRYLKLTVFNGKDENGKVEIKSVDAFHLVEEPYKPEPVPIAFIGGNERKHITEIDLDLQYKNLPLDTLTLSFEEENFFRRIRVGGKNGKTFMLKKTAEDGSVVEEERPAPWKVMPGRVIYRYSAGKYEDDLLTHNMQGQKARYVQVLVLNMDDPPLTLVDAAVTRLTQTVSFKAKPGKSYSLYFGYEDAKRPSYDLQHYLDRLESEGVAPATLGSVITNPYAGQKTDQAPWSEQYSWVIWIVLIAIFAVLALMIVRQIKSAKTVN